MMPKIMHTAGFFEAVNDGDVRMIQRREGLRFACEAREPVGVAGVVAS